MELFPLPETSPISLATSKHPSHLGSKVTSSRKPSAISLSLSLQAVCLPFLPGAPSVVPGVGGEGGTWGEGRQDPCSSASGSQGHADTSVALLAHILAPHPRWLEAARWESLGFSQ